MKRVLLTGATGFIGGALLKHLCDRGYQVAYLRRPTSAAVVQPAVAYTVERDTDIADALGSFRPDVVIHLAADTARPTNAAGVRELVEANVVFGSLLCNAMVETGCHALVNAGTYWQFGENGAYSPNTLYAATKQAFQDVVTWFANMQLRAITLILFDVFGPFDARPKLITDLVRAVREGTPMDASTGQQLVCPIYIDDVCTAFEHAALLVSSGESTGHALYAANTEIRVSVRDMVEHFLRAVAVPVEVRWGAKPQRAGQVQSPVRALPLLPGWRPQFDLPCAMESLARAEGLALHQAMTAVEERA